MPGPLSLKFFLFYFACLLVLPCRAQKVTDGKEVRLVLHDAGKDTAFNFQALGLQAAFGSQPDAINYMNTIPKILVAKGYPAASVDSFWTEENAVHVVLYTGRKYQWVNLQTNLLEKPALNAAGFIEKNYLNKPVNFSQLSSIQQRLLNYYENNGYPFAKVYLDSITITDDRITASLKAEKGLLYHIDSIRVVGKVKINPHFLQRYLSLPNGSIYSKEKLQDVDVRILELPFLQPVQASDLTMLGSGSVLNLYVEPKRSSQVNFLVGFLPSTGVTKKLQVTGDVHLDLKNLLGGGEEILLKWQQLQPKSPRLNLGFTRPYIFNSPFGLNFLFDLFKKDSNFLQVNAQAGVQYQLSARQSGKLFVQWQNNSLLSGAVDTNIIKLQKELPPNIDVGAVNTGISYELLATNYRLNPRKGNEVNLTSLVGVKTIRQNTDITNIKDPSFNYSSLYDSLKTKNYQLRIKATAAHYFPVGKSSTLKATGSAGYYTSPTVFRNELFQIGGYRLLRGFSEESIYASRYLVFSAEYRYLVDLNSYLFAFADVGFVKNKYQAVNTDNQFTGAGLGILFETKAGLLNISYAIGKRDDVKFNLREASKLHFGYINYF
jgi:outer membrane protein assembly factor BamA